MPIYAYRCNACGHAQDVLQKLSDPVLDTCPSCGAQAFAKQVTAAGFQLKGSGWYVTDFRGGQKTEAPKDGAAKPADKPAGGESSSTPAATKDSGDAKPSTGAATTTSAPAAASSGPSPSP